MDSDFKNVCLERLINRVKRKKCKMKIDVKVIGNEHIPARYNETYVALE